ncbi:hypothetical protein FB009_114138 [Sinorhizobium medicae]|nr:hypothetical protein FB009_114138 [Sinorhizobium medicae]
MLSRSPICSCCEKHRPPRRRSYSDSRSFHRPGRPDSRHHRDPRQVTPQRHGTGFRFPAPRGQGTQRGRGHGGYHRGRVKGIDLPRRKSSGRDVGSLTFAGMRRLDLAFHIATKLNRSHLLVARTSLYPALPWSNGSRYSRVRPPSGHCRGFDVDGARITRVPEAAGDMVRSETAL